MTLEVTDTTPADVGTNPSAAPAASEQPAPSESAPETPANETPAASAESDKDRAAAIQAATQRRISQLTREKYQERARREQLEQELARTRQPADGEQGQPQPRQAIPQEAVEREAERIASARELNRRCNEIAQSWRAEAKTDFERERDALSTILPLFNDEGRPEPFLQAVMESEAPAKVLRHLAANPDVAASLADLSPLQQARKLALIEHSLSQPIPRQPAKTPAPLEPVGTPAGDAEPDPANAERWIAWRNRQVAARRR